MKPFNPKSRPCKGCDKPFVPAKPLQAVCSLRCAAKKVKQDKAEERAKIAVDGLFEVAKDETRNDCRTRYFKRVGNVLEFAVNLDQTRLDIAKPSGASMTGSTQPEAGAVARTVQSKLSDIKSRADYASDAAFAEAVAASATPSIDGNGRLAATVNAPDGVIYPLSAIGDAAKISQRPAVIEQHFTGFYGRGMLTAEPINVTTETTVSTAAAGAVNIALGDTSKIVVGGCITVLHDNGRYATYFVKDKDGDVLGIAPKLKWACTYGKARGERTWYNRAHPGKFYIRELAQRIANAQEYDTNISNNDRLMFVNQTADAKYSAENKFVAISGTSINTYDASNAGYSAYGPVRFGPGRSTYVEGFTAVDNGAETPLFETRGNAQIMVRVLFAARGACTYKIRVIDENTDLIGMLKIPGGADHEVLREYRLPINARNSRRFKVQVMVDTFAAGENYFVVGYIDAFAAPALSGPVITNRSARIVCLGDSWVTGDLASTAEREPLTTQLQKELPYAFIKNAGVGGNNVIDLLNRFDADVAPYKPDYVVINVGTNDSYNPLSSVFEPTAIRNFLRAYGELLSKVSAIGARAIVIGVPALAQSDAETPTLAEYTLNDHAKAYVREWLAWEGGTPSIFVGSNNNGTFIRHPDGRLECFYKLDVPTTAANQLASKFWTFPTPFLAGSEPRVQATLANYATSQVISVGANSASETRVEVAAVSSVGAYPCQINLEAKGFWR